MNWKECVEKEIITKTEPDTERSKKMVQMAEIRLEFWEKEVDKKHSSLKVEAYYDIIKELIFAHIYKNGYNCKNHICLIAYLKEHMSNFDFEIEKIDELRKVRNEIAYRGFNVQDGYLKRNEFEFKSIIKKLEQEIEKL